MHGLPFSIRAVIRGLRDGTKDFASSCFHSASTGLGNANAAPEGGV